MARTNVFAFGLAFKATSTKVFPEFKLVGVMVSPAEFNLFCWNTLRAAPEAHTFFPCASVIVEQSVNAITTIYFF
jgi:hypothetical protein